MNIKNGLIAMSNDICDPKTLAARTAAFIDDLLGTDNSKAVQDAMDENNAFHYTMFGSKLADERTRLLYARIGVSDKLKEASNRYSDKPFLQHSLTLLRGHNDLDVFPHEVLGEHIVGPIRTAHKAFTEQLQGYIQNHPEEYKAAKNDPEGYTDFIKDLKEGTGYAEARAQAVQDINDFYGDGQDPERYQYANAWLNRNFPDDELSNSLKYWSNNLSSAYTKNNPLLIYRHFFDQFRTAEAFGFQSYLEGRSAFLQARAFASPELHQIAARADVYGHNQFDLLHKVAKFNQGVTYYSAKTFALKNGLSEAEAIQFAQLSVEHLQYQTSPVDQPRAFWNSNGLLALMKFQVLERRWTLSLWQNLGKGFQLKHTPEGQALFHQSAKTLLTIAALKTVIFGASSNLPAETDYLDVFSPKLEETLKQLDKFSISGILNIDLGEPSRVPLTPIGFVARAGLIFNSLGHLTEQATQVMNHPSNLKSTVTLMAGGIRFAPDVTPFGNGNIANGLMLLYRAFTGDYIRKTKGKPYQTDFTEELENFLRGGHESLDRNIEKQKLNAGE